MKKNTNREPQGPEFYVVFEASRATIASQALAWFSSREAAERAQVAGTVVKGGDRVFGLMFMHTEIGDRV